MSKSGKHFLLISLLIFINTWTHADSVVFKNGSKTEGKIIKELENGVIFETEGCQVVIPKDNISKLIKSNTPSTAETDPGKQDAEKFTVYREIMQSQGVGSSVQKTISEKQTKDFLDALKKSEEASKEQNYLKAIGLFEVQLEKFPDPPFCDLIKYKLAEAYSAQSLEYMVQNEKLKAFAAIRRAIMLNTRSSNAHFVFGYLLIQNNMRRDIAKREFDLALKCNPQNKEASFYLKMLADEIIPKDHIPSLDAIPVFSEKTIQADIAGAFERTKQIEDESEMYQKFRPETRELALLLAGYNAGPSAVITYSGAVPYPETVEYIKRVFKYLESPPENNYMNIIDAKAKKYGFDPALINAIIKVESDYNEKDITKNWAGGARGLIQLIKEDWIDTTKRMGVRWKYEDNVFDPEKNLEVGCNYLKWLMDYHVSHWTKNQFDYALE